MSHSWFAASASSRWLQCGASAVINTSRLPREYKPAADRGTALHAISEDLLRGGHSDLPSGLSPADGEAVMEYVDYVRSLGGEKWYELSTMFVDQCGGTSDCVAVHDGELLHVIDAKFGTWMVDPVENTQMIIYALGCLRHLGVLYDFKRVRMTIAQPACGDPRSWEIGIKDLVHWGRVIADRVTAIMEGDAEFNPHPDTCRWCPGRSICPAKAAFGKVAAKQQFDDSNYGEEPDDQGDALELLEILDGDPDDWTWEQKKRVADMAGAWVKAVEGQIKGMLLQGEDVPGFKVVEGQRRRDWKGDEGKKSAKKYLEDEGFDESQIYTDPKFVSPSQAEGLFTGKGSGDKKSAMKGWIKKNKGAPTVVPASDSRPPIDKKMLAKQEFDADVEE